MLLTCILDPSLEEKERFAFDGFLHNVQPLDLASILVVKVEQTAESKSTVNYLLSAVYCAPS
jgi:hypothetical protein